MKAPIPVLALPLALILGGCVATTPNWDQQFGASTATLMTQQVRSPDASQANADRPVDGIEGRAARESMDRYYKSFAQPPKPYNVLTLSVPGAQNGGR